MEKKYVKPEIEVLKIVSEDIIMTSGINRLPNDNHPGDNEVKLGL